MTEKLANMSQTIRDYADRHPVFGSGEIRALYGEKAALLVTRLAAKGQFVRIRNGVFGKVEVKEDHPDYQAYLSRMHDALLARAASPEATVADRLFAWASERDSFSVGEASRHFGQDMKGHVAPYVKRGKIERVSEGVYRYLGEVPAARRETSPMAEADGQDHAAVLLVLRQGAMTAAEVARRTGLDVHRLRAVLTRLAHDGRLVRLAPASTNAHHVYHLPEAPATELDSDTLSLLAIVAASGTLSTRGARTHHLDDTPRRMQDLHAAGLIEEAGPDPDLGGVAYAPTLEGRQVLDHAGYRIDGTEPLLHRPLERAILATLALQGPCGYDALHQRVGEGKTRNQIELAVARLVKVAAVSTDGAKPCTVAIAAFGNVPSA